MALQPKDILVATSDFAQAPQAPAIIDADEFDRETLDWCWQPESRERLGPEDGIPMVTGLAAFEAPARTG